MSRIKVFWAMRYTEIQSEVLAGSGPQPYPEYLPFLAGQSYSLMHDIKPADKIVPDIVRDAKEVINRLTWIRSSPQPA